MMGIIDMFEDPYLKASASVGIAKVVCFGLFLAITPAKSTAEILWSGDYDTGDYTQWSVESNPVKPQFSGIPSYGRPVYPSDGATRYPGVDPSIFGNGDLMGLVTSPVRNGTHANRVVVKNQSNTSEPADCDNGACYRRHTNLNNHVKWGADVMPYMSERWMSVSHYVPADWDTRDVGGSWGIHVFEVKSGGANSIGGPIFIDIKDGHWRIEARWNPDSEPLTATKEWYWDLFFAGDHNGAGPYPRTNATTGLGDHWADGTKFFPDEATSHAALKSLNRGGWTDWVMHVKWDGRGTAEGGTGFFKVWKREDNGPWIHVLDLYPSVTNRGGGTPDIDHGIGWNIPGKGYGLLLGMYTDKEQALESDKDRVIYNDNVKIGGENATFADMSPDGSAPGTTAQQSIPLPPAFTGGN